MSIRWIRILLVPFLLCLPISLGLAADPAVSECIVPRAPHRGHVLPQVLRLELRVLEGIDDQGFFEGACTVEATRYDMKVALRLAPNEGVTLEEKPNAMRSRAWTRGTLRKGKPYRFRFKCKVDSAAFRPAGVNIKARYTFPRTEIRSEVEAKQGVYANPRVAAATMRYLDSRATQGKITLNRCLLF